MSTLLLRLAAPMQSWGSGSRFDVRRTEREPTKSGVIGLLAAALGRRRDESVSDLSALRFGVRIDREGTLLRDFHIAQKMKNGKFDTSYVTHRYYLCDAVFLAAFESDDEALMKRLEIALQNPAFPLFLGRRSCPPEGRLVLGVRPLPLLDALKREPLMAEPTGDIRIVLDSDNVEKNTSIIADMPFSYDPGSRKYTYRAVRQVILPVENRRRQEHDPMSGLE